jgi:hypothetical protein
LCLGIYTTCQHKHNDEQSYIPGYHSRGFTHKCGKIIALKEIFKQTPKS